VELGAAVQRPADDQFYVDRDRQPRDLAEDAEWLVGLFYQLIPASRRWPDCSG